LLCAAIAFPSQTDKVQSRIDNITHPQKSGDDSWSWRKGEWRRMFPHGADHLLTGTGFGSYSRITVKEFGTQDPRYSTAVTPGRLGFAAHNDYLKMFVEDGLPGFVLWVLVLTGSVALMWRARRPPGLRGYATAGVALSIAFLGMSFSDNIQAYTAVLIYAFGFFGAVAGAAGIGRRTGPRPEAAPTGSRAAPGPA
jgi:O-antigen ligase